MKRFTCEKFEFTVDSFKCKRRNSTLKSIFERNWTGPQNGDEAKKYCVFVTSGLPRNLKLNVFFTAACLSCTWAFTASHVRLCCRCRSVQVRRAGPARLPGDRDGGRAWWCDLSVAHGTSPLRVTQQNNLAQSTRNRGRQTSPVFPVSKMSNALPAQTLNPAFVWEGTEVPACCKVHLRLIQMNRHIHN